LKAKKFLVVVSDVDVDVDVDGDVDVDDEMDCC